MESSVTTGSLHKYKIMHKTDAKYHFKSIFNGNTGFYVRSDTFDTKEDPFMASYPELIDIGIMEKCVCAHRCNVDCYQKAIDRTGENMSLDNFRWIIEQSKGKVFQVALGGAGDPDTHENFGDILKVCADNNIVPNFTTSGIALTDDSVKLCKEYCGAVAVSEHFADYTDKAIKMLLDAGVKTNVHYVLSKKTIKQAIKIVGGDIDYHPGINAVVFLLYKPVGLGKIENCLTPEDPEVIQFFSAFSTRKCKFKVGFDSCCASGLVNYATNFDAMSLDFCEGARYSMYISADMKAMPCSFANQDPYWSYQLDKEHTIKDAWESKKFEIFRNRLIFRCPECSDQSSCAGACPMIKEVCLCNRPEKHRGSYVTGEYRASSTLSL